MTIGDSYDKKNNIFTILEIVLAILIVYFHCYPIYYGSNTQYHDIFTRIFHLSLGNIVVAMFFVISGFFIVDSIKNSKNTGEYLKKRIKKIYPPLLFFLLLFSLVISPIVSRFDYWDALSHSEYYMNYITSNLLFFQNNSYAIYGVFENLPYQIAISGSLWTIKHTIYMYLVMIPIFNGMIKKEKTTTKYNIYFLIISFFAIISEFGLLNDMYETIAKWNPNLSLFVEFKQFIKLLFFFSSGVFIKLNSNRIKNSYLVAGILIILFIIGRIFNINNYLLYFVIPYLTIFLGCFKFDKLKLKPYSYHIYIGGFAIQQLLIYFFYPNIGFKLFMIISIVVSVMYGLLSYYLTENIIYSKVKK